MNDNPPPFKGPDIRTPILIPMKGRGIINQASTLLPMRRVTAIKMRA